MDIGPHLLSYVRDPPGSGARCPVAGRDDGAKLDKPPAGMVRLPGRA